MSLGPGCYSAAVLLSSAGAGAAAGAAASGAASACFCFLGASRFTNFFLGLGNAKASPLAFWAVPPASVIFFSAERLYQPATTVSFLVIGPSPKIFTG